MSHHIILQYKYHIYVSTESDTFDNKQVYIEFTVYLQTIFLGVSLDYYNGLAKLQQAVQKRLNTIYSEIFLPNHFTKLFLKSSEAGYWN